MQQYHFLEPSQQRLRQPYPSNNKECPWVSPYIYYADSSTRQCVINCPSTPSLYANDFTQSCVSSTITIIQHAHTMQPPKHTTTITIADACSVDIGLYRLSCCSILLRAGCLSYLWQLCAILSFWKIRVGFE